MKNTAPAPTETSTAAMDTTEPDESGACASSAAMSSKEPMAAAASAKTNVRKSAAAAEMQQRFRDEKTAAEKPQAKPPTATRDPYRGTPAGGVPVSVTPAGTLKQDATGRSL